MQNIDVQPISFTNRAKVENFFYLLVQSTCLNFEFFIIFAENLTKKKSVKNKESRRMKKTGLFNHRTSKRWYKQMYSFCGNFEQSEKNPNFYDQKKVWGGG